MQLERLTCFLFIFISKWIFLDCYWKCERELQVQVIGFASFHSFYMFFLKILLLIYSSLICSSPRHENVTACSYVEKHFIYNSTNAKRYQTIKSKTHTVDISLFHHSIIKPFPNYSYGPRPTGEITLSSLKKVSK